MTETPAARKARRARHEAAIADLRTMTDDQLKDLSHELGREKDQIGRVVGELNARLDAVRSEPKHGAVLR